MVRELLCGIKQASFSIETAACHEPRYTLCGIGNQYFIVDFDEMS
jgi:hypothetical protein